MVRIVGSNRGVFVVEAALLTIPFILMLFLLLESFRREVFNILLGHIVCAEVRGRALGESPDRIEHKAKDFLKSSLGEVLGKSTWKASRGTHFRATDLDKLSWLRVGKHPGGVSERILRYEQFISFENKNRKKHHQEIIKRCLFPFS
ncbi:hypothetical protein EBT16_03880 [bacterium]|nr:hypothetical protein [bacterium]